MGKFLKAIKDNKIDDVRRILNENKDLINSHYAETTALMLACKHGHTAIARFLIDAGAAVNICNEQEKTALMWASSNNHYHVIKLLVESGADLNLQNTEGETALIIACKNGHEKSAYLLLEHGADIDLKDNYHHSALERASDAKADAIVDMVKTAHTADRLLAGKDIGAIKDGQEELFISRVTHKLVKHFDKAAYDEFKEYSQEHYWELPDESQELLENAEAQYIESLRLADLIEGEHQLPLTGSCSDDGWGGGGDTL